jgi:ribosomal protein L22
MKCLNTSPLSPKKRRQVCEEINEGTYNKKKYDATKFLIEKQKLDFMKKLKQKVMRRMLEVKGVKVNQKRPIDNDMIDKFMKHKIKPMEPYLNCELYDEVLCQMIPKNTRSNSTRHHIKEVDPRLYYKIKNREIERMKSKPLSNIQLELIAG